MAPLYFGGVPCGAGGSDHGYRPLVVMWPGPCTGNEETRTPELGIQPWSFLEKAWNYMDKTIGKLCVFFPLAASAPNWRCRSHGAGVRMRVWTRFFGTMYAKHCVHGCCFWTWNIGSVQIFIRCVTASWRRRVEFMN